jgi:hypothetical protein
LLALRGLSVRGQRHRTTQTLLYYGSANDITPKLPLSVRNADAIAAVLLAAGAEVE